METDDVLEQALSLVTLSILSLACYIYSAIYNPRSDSKIYLQTENDLHSIQFATEKSPPKVIKASGLSPNTNNNTVYNANEKMLRLVNGISSNHPASTENLWIEIDHKW